MTQWHKLIKFSDEIFRITETNHTWKSISIVSQLQKSSTSLMLSPSNITISSTSRNWFNTTGTMEAIWVFTAEVGCFQAYSISLWEGTINHSSCSFYQMVVASSCIFYIYFKVLHFFSANEFMNTLISSVFKIFNFNTRSIIFFRYSCILDTLDALYED